MQTRPGLFLKSLLEWPGNLLEISSVKFVDTLSNEAVITDNNVVAKSPTVIIKLIVIVLAYLLCRNLSLFIHLTNS